ncbi:MAG: ATP-binding protein [Peptostreptococcaceae bacterium]
MSKTFKRIILFTSLLLLLVGFNLILVHSENEDGNLINKSVLVLCSYNSQSLWESDIIRGLNETIENKINLKIEYLDSSSNDTDEFLESYMDFLNVKYKNKKIDCVLAIDDEALMLAKNLIFDENSFMYHKDLIFAGVNDYIPLTSEEQKYIKGIFEYQDNSDLIDIILKASSKVDTIYLLLDNNIYCDTLERNINTISNTAERNLNIVTLRSEIFDELKSSIKDINPKTSAVILSGVYFDNASDNLVKPDVLIKEIKTLTKAPIYTTLNPYILNGAIGGLVNDGYKLGKIVSKFLMDTLNKSQDLHLTISFNNSFSKLVFNYNELMKYNINPKIFPTDTEFINKGPFDLLVSKTLKNIIYAAILIFILLLIYMFISNLKDKKIAAEKDKLLNESLERDKIRTDFVLTMSHELRTPLNIITNSTSLLNLKVVNNDIDPKFFTSQLSMISKNSNRLLRLINNLIDVSKIQLGHMDSTFKNENIVEVIEDTTLCVVDLANSHDINVVFDTDEEEIITSIDRGKIERIMLNLLSNSIKFTNSGGEIFVKVEKIDENIVITVKDNGIGMSDTLQNHLFEKFSKEKSYNSLERAYEGSGLGLYIVKGLVNLHHGTIKVVSQVNVGTTFIITIPQVIIDTKGDSGSLSWAPIDYVTKIELSDIDKE